MADKPQTINVLGHEYAVEFVEDLKHGGEGVDGYVGYNDFKIEIEAGIKEQGQRVTLMHEVMHVILRMTGHITESNDEGMAESIAFAVVGLMQNNPELVSYLAGNAKNGHK
jgi:hypothetical protein